jgi:PIN domain nuclease of toxin-antitoxin system
LLDTSVALLAVSTPELLSARIRKAIERGPAFLSVIAYWEVMIKSMKGVLNVGDPRLWYVQTLDVLGLQALAFRPEHIAAIFPLPPIHQDRFDRALIAQATADDLVLLTTDTIIPQYASRNFQVMR